MSLDDDAGFTLIELVIVLAIIAILAAISVPNYLSQAAATQNAVVVTDLTQAKSAMVIYGTDHGGALTDDQDALADYGLAWSSGVTAGSISLVGSDGFCVHATSASGTRYAITADTAAAPGSC